jgi:regulator of RNase E activity RraA
MDRLTEIDLEFLREIDTPTICNIVETIDPGRASYGYTFRHLHCIFPDMRPIVGYARTAAVRARRPTMRSSEESSVFREAYFDYVGSGTEPKISIVQDLDEQPGYGALWGEVSTHVHKALGVKGVVTNGSVRDVDMVAVDFQLLAGLVAPSRAHVHYCDFGREVNVHGMTVNDGDLIHADKHGAVVIPPHILGEIPSVLDLLIRKEEAILQVARSPDCTAEMLKVAHRASARITV